MYREKNVSDIISSVDEKNAIIIDALIYRLPNRH